MRDNVRSCFADDERDYLEFKILGNGPHHARSFFNLVIVLAKGHTKMHRRYFLATALGAVVGAGAARRPLFADGTPISLAARPTTVGLVGADLPKTQVWAYNQSIPGPVIRAQQGEQLHVTFENGLSEPSTIHWHGLRVPVEQDGVPFFSQQPVRPGGQHLYTLPLEDAGTFWYHPHVNSSEQLGRGLNGVLIVEEPPEVAARLSVDRELIWTIDDWRLDEGAQIAPFGNRHDASHGGRFGNFITVNGRQDLDETVTAGERVRLRLVNVANAQFFHLRFQPLDPWVIALDGHPVEPARLGDAGVWLGPGQRADLVVDIDLEPGAYTEVVDTAYGPDQARAIMAWRVSDAAPVRPSIQSAPEGLPPNPVPKPDLESAEQHTLVFEGGAMGGMAQAKMDGRMLDMRSLAEAGRFWAINGSVPADVRSAPPLLELALGRSHVINLENRTRWVHPIHLHGHSFVVSDPRLPDGSPSVIRDTVLMAPNETTQIAFVADNPGRWMLHCHVLEHQGSGMMGTIQVG